MAKETISLNVEGMSCNHCEMTVKKAVGALNGVSAVNVDLKSKRVTVDMDTDKVSVDTIKDVIEDQGYEVKQ
ncbi:MAG: copper chaperone CopZ [Candidatus Saccharibacteria bacterium]